MAAIYGTFVYGEGTYNGDSFLIPIYDRTLEDVNRVNSLNRLGIANMTAAELTEWFSDLKGAYNISDLNRVESIIGYTASYLAGYGYSATITAKGSSWLENEVPTVEELERIRVNVSNLLAVFPVKSDTPALPGSLNPMDYNKANAIEHIIYDIKDLVDKMIAVFRYCGTTYCGG